MFNRSLHRAAAFAWLAALPLAAQFDTPALPGIDAFAVRPRPYRAPAGEAWLRQEAKRFLPSLRYSLALPAAHRLPALTAADIPAEHNPLSTRAGVHRPLDAAALRVGRWQTLDNGRKLWRMVIESPGAAAIRLHLAGFNVGRGRVWLHDGLGRDEEIVGPYSDRGIYGDSDFWTDFVHSDQVVIEYEAEPGATTEETPFEIQEVSHLFPGVLPMAGETGNPRAAAASCNLDISCYPEWAETAKSVGHIVYEDRGSTYVCSGTLLAQRNGGNVPYFLTADHCINSDTTARTVQAYWFYQTSRCNGPAVTRASAQRTLGARYLISGGPAQGDFSLIQMNSVPGGVTFAGWSTTEVPLGAALAGIHHPSGDYKRFSRGTRVATRSGLAGANLARYVSPAFSEGIVQPGSSGSGLFTQAGVLVGNLSSGPKTDTDAQACAIKPFTANYGALATYYSAISQYLDGRAGTGTDTPPPTTTGKVLQSGVAASFTLEPVSGPTLYGGENAFRIQVPAGATRLEIKLAASAQVAFYVRKDAVPAVTSGRVTADFSSPDSTGNETLVVTPQSQPALTAGTYYIALGLFATNTRAQGTLTATVTTAAGGGGGGGTGATPGANELVSGRAARFSMGPVTGATLLNGASGFRITVPAGARGLSVKIATDNAAHDVDLYLRFGQDVALSGGQVVADHLSEGDTGNEELSLTAATQPALRAGTYYVAFGLYARNVTVTGTVTATITGGETTTPPPTTPTPGNPLISGTPRSFSIAPAALPTLLSGAQAYAIAVAQNAARLDVRLATATANADLDLYVRYGAPPEIQGDRIVADFASTGPTGNEIVSVAPNTNPALRAGTYYVAIAIFTKGVAVNGTVTATTVQAGGGDGAAPGGASGNPLRPNVTERFTIAPVAQSTILNGQRGFLVQVPAGSTRLELALRSITPNVDVDLFARKDIEPAVLNGKVQADFSSTGATGNETIVISTASNPPLRAGTYFVALGVFTAGVTIDATLTATIAGNPGSSVPGGPVLMQSGQPYGVGIDPVTGPTLISGSNTFAIDVPDRAMRLELRLSTQTPGVDVDLFARYNTPVIVQQGRVVYDHTSDGPTGNEVITVINGTQPTLRPGRYHISLGVFTPNTPITATLTATVVVNAPAQAPVLSRVLTPEAPSKFALPAAGAPTLFMGDYSYHVTVPEGVRRMKIRVDSDVSSIDVDVYARYEQDNDLDGEGGVATDHASEGDTGNEELIIGSDSEPPLRPGTYYISLANFTKGEPATGQISIEFEREVATPSLSAARTLDNGVPQRFELGAVSNPTLFGGDRGFRFDVPAGRGTLEVTVRSDNPAVDVDLFARYGGEPEVVDGRVAADYRSIGDSGDEALVIHRMSIPPLRPGFYFFRLGLYTTGAPSSGMITARFMPEEAAGSAVAAPVVKEYRSTAGEAEPQPALAAKPGWEVQSLLPDDYKVREAMALAAPMALMNETPARGIKRALRNQRQEASTPKE